jgi:hypothetical protein
MITIKIPTDIVLCIPNTLEPITKPDGTHHKANFKDFVRVSLLSDPRWVSTYKDLCTAAVLCENINNAEDEWLVEDHDYTKFVEALRLPILTFVGWHEVFLPQLKPFFDAILSAGGLPLISVDDLTTYPTDLGLNDVQSL